MATAKKSTKAKEEAEKKAAEPASEVSEKADKPAAKKSTAKKSTTKKTAAAKAVDSAAEESPAEEKPAKKAPAKKRTAKKAAEPASEEAAPEEKPAKKTARKTTKKAAEEPAVEEAPKKAPAKKRASKKAAAEEAPAAEEAKPAKKAPAKKKAAPKKKAPVKIVEEDENGKHLIVDPSIEKVEYVEQALADGDILTALVESLCGEARRARQFSATILAQIAREKPEVLVPSIPSIVDALHRPEAQTRWEALDALYELVALDKNACAKAIDGAEVSLDDEDNGAARLAAFRFLCKLGASDSKLAGKVWPNIDGGIQWFHGDPEFQEMLDELIVFAQETDNKTVRSELADRMSFDATNGKGALKRKATQIVEACK
ncbi:MAG: hypothetical protein ACOYIP_03920 [Coriobacteriales bacterium]|jgi:hypothetical protein